MSRPLIFLGHSIQVIEFIDTCEMLNIPIAGIIDSDYYGNTEHYEDVPFIGSEHDVDFAALRRDHDFFVGVSPIPNVPRNLKKRRDFIDIVKKHDLPCANLIDPESRVNRRLTIGQGVFIGWMVGIGPHVRIGDHCQINCLAGIVHHSQLGENVCLQRRAALISGVTVEDDVILGIDSRVYKSGVTIGQGAYIHPSITVMRDVQPYEVLNLAAVKNNRVY